MLRLLADENFRDAITRGLHRREPELDLVRAQDVGLAGKSDPAILERAASENRLVLTHDARTFTVHAYERVAAGLAMPGVLEVRQNLRVGQAIEEILIVAECSREGEWEGRVGYIPLQ